MPGTWDEPNWHHGRHHCQGLAPADIKRAALPEKIRFLAVDIEMPESLSRLSRFSY